MIKDYNSKLDQIIESFIQMRIEGKSFDDIAAELKVSKQSLIEWNKKEIAREAIKEGKAFRINALVKAHNFSLENRLRAYLALSDKINTELLNRDLTNDFELPTAQLLKMSLSNDARIFDILKNYKVHFGSPAIEEIIFDNDPDQYFRLDILED